jgi:triacylglycerol lipase
LRNEGIETHHASVSFATDVSVRGKELAENIWNILEEENHEKVHIIAHSMGGLDARYMLVNEDIADRVASLTTIGTPHLGTSYAVHALRERRAGDIIDFFREHFGIDWAGFLTLTPEERLRFNREARNAEAKNQVKYHVYAGQQEREKLRSFLRHPWDVIQKAEGPNDGLVSVRSQMWTAELVADDGTRKTIHQHKFPVSADHSNEIGWWDMNEVEHGKWWFPWVLNNRRDYEAQIRDAYLMMAREVRGEL